MKALLSLAALLLIAFGLSLTSTDTPMPEAASPGAPAVPPSSSRLPIRFRSGRSGSARPCAVGCGPVAAPAPCVPVAVELRRAATSLRHAVRRVLLLYADAVLRLLGAARLHELLSRARQLLFPQGLLVQFVRPPLLQLAERPHASRRVLPGAPRHEERRLTLRRAEARREGRGLCQPLALRLAQCSAMAAAFETLRLASALRVEMRARTIAMLARQLTEAFALGAEHEGERLRQGKRPRVRSPPSSARPTRKKPALAELGESLREILDEHDRHEVESAACDLGERAGQRRDCAAR